MGKVHSNMLLMTSMGAARQCLPQNSRAPLTGFPLTCIHVHRNIAGQVVLEAVPSSSTFSVTSIGMARSAPANWCLWSFLGRIWGSNAASCLQAVCGGVRPGAHAPAGACAQRGPAQRGPRAGEGANTPLAASHEPRLWCAILASVRLGPRRKRLFWHASIRGVSCARSWACSRA